GRPGRVCRDRALARHVRRHLRGPRHDARGVRAAARARRGDVQPGRPRPQRWRCVQRDGEVPMSGRSRRLLALSAGLVTGLALALAAWVAWPLPAGLLAPAPELSFTLADRHGLALRTTRAPDGSLVWSTSPRSEEHTSELQ